MLTVTPCGAVAAIVVSEQSVREMADARSFARGRAYLDAGRVRRLAVDGTTVTAIVEGTSAYRVRLAVTRAGLDATCSCPYGSEGVFCKHCVAAALSWLDGGSELGEPAQQPVPAVPRRPIHCWVRGSLSRRVRRLTMLTTTGRCARAWNGRSRSATSSTTGGRIPTSWMSTRRSQRWPS